MTNVTMGVFCHTCFQFNEKWAQRQNLVLFWWNELRQLLIPSTRFINTTPDSVFAPFYHETGNTYDLCTVVLTKRSSNLTWYVEFQQPLFLPKPAVDLCFLAAGFVRPVASPPARHGERPSCYCVWLARLPQLSTGWPICLVKTLCWLSSDHSGS